MNDEKKRNWYAFSYVSYVDVEESLFFNVELEISPSFMKKNSSKTKQ